MIELQKDRFGEIIDFVKAEMKSIAEDRGDYIDWNEQQNFSHWNVLSSFLYEHARDDDLTIEDLKARYAKHFDAFYKGFKNDKKN